MQAWDLSCGAAALATLLNYHHGDPVTELEITRVLIDRDIYLETPELVRLRQGFSLADLARFAQARGYRPSGYGKLVFADLEELSPLILPIVENGQSHFVVFRGTSQDRVLLSDPAFGVRTMRRSNFERLWKPVSDDVGRVGFVVHRRDGFDPPDRLRAKPADFITFG
ncbi:MAG: cysteine peptidase family C39 domain-containing protein [Geminicoccaceae bacterium]